MNRMDNRKTDTLPLPTGKEEKSYTFRKKKIWKGKMAPLGFLYAVVTLKSSGKVYTVCQIVDPKKSDLLEKEKELRDQILKKYKV